MSASSTSISIHVSGEPSATSASRISSASASASASASSSASASASGPPKSTSPSSSNPNPNPLLRNGISRLSTGHICDNCRNEIYRLEWIQCGYCHHYELCHHCASLTTNLPVISRLERNLKCPVNKTNQSITAAAVIP